MCAESLQFYREVDERQREEIRWQREELGRCREELAGAGWGQSCPYLVGAELKTSCEGCMGWGARCW